MKTLLLAFQFLVSTSAFASDNLPFADTYGTYQFVSCKEIESRGNLNDYCSSKIIRIQPSPACSGAPHTDVLFAKSDKNFDIAPCTRNGMIPSPIIEGFSPDRGINPKFYKYEKEKDGSDHYYIRSIMNEQTLIFTDAWMKRNPDKTLNFKLKRRETPKDDSQNTLMSFEYEFVLKPTK